MPCPGYVRWVSWNIGEASINQWTCYENYLSLLRFVWTQSVTIVPKNRYTNTHLEQDRDKNCTGSYVCNCFSRQFSIAVLTLKLLLAFSCVHRPYAKQLESLVHLVVGFAEELACVSRPKEACERAIKNLMFVSWLLRVNWFRDGRTRLDWVVAGIPSRCRH